MRNLTTSDPAALEAALEAAAMGTIARVTLADGERLKIYRVQGGWHLPGDVVVASGDVADGRPRAVTLAEPGGQAPDLAELADALRGEYLSPPEAIARARALFDAARAPGATEEDRLEAEAGTGELDDLDSVGVPGAGALRDEIWAWLDLFGEDPYDEEDGL